MEFQRDQIFAQKLYFYPTDSRPAYIKGDHLIANQNPNRSFRNGTSDRVA